MITYKDLELNQLLSLIRNERCDSAFDELVARYTPMINKLVSGFSNNGSTRGELFSESCFALHKAALSYDIERQDSVTFGLYAEICVYRRLSDVTANKRKGIAVVDVDVDTISAETNIEQRLVYRERVNSYLSIARSVLSDYEYSVLMLYVNGDTTVEIARKLSKDEKSVENAKTRMFRRLRESAAKFSDN